VPRWASWARTVVRALVVLYVLTWLFRAVLELSNLVLDTEFFRGDSPTWTSVAFAVLVSAAGLCGLVWLAGEVVAGYREPSDT